VVTGVLFVANKGENMKQTLMILVIGATTITSANATISVRPGYVSPLVRSIQLQQQRAADAAAAQALANATGQPQYANGAVYNPQPAPVTTTP